MTDREKELVKELMKLIVRIREVPREELEPQIDAIEKELGLND